MQSTGGALHFLLCRCSMDKKQVKISVRALVEFILQSGDIDNRKGKLTDKEAMQLGSRIHRKIQKSMGTDYQSEVVLRFQREFPDLILAVEGRADGILERDKEVCIDEIKGTYHNLYELTEPIEVHKAQAKCYAWMYCQEHPQQTIKVQVTYCHMETEEIRRFPETYEWKDLDQWFEKLIADYYRWVSFREKWRKKRNESMKQLTFPFDYREGQKTIVSSVYRTIQSKKELFVQAPTGVGKTMSAVYPAVRAVGEGLGETIFYLTARTIARTVAEEAFSILRKQGLNYKVITLTAKEKLCILEEVDCNPSSCPRAKGHYDRINDAVFELLTSGHEFDRETILKQSEKWNVCPYELSLDLAIWVDAVICDYNYVFDPRVHLRRFFGEGTKGEYLFLIDEAHNLAERGREMYSADLCKEDFLALRKKVKSVSGKLNRYLSRCNQQLLELKRDCDVAYQEIEYPGAFVISLLNLQGELENFLEENHDLELQKEVLEFYFLVRTFLNITDLLDENYVIYMYHDEEQHFHIKLFCVNPANNLQQFIQKGHAAVFFSATLLPIGYYKRLLGSDDGQDYAIYIDSPFPKENRKIMISREVSSRYNRRGYEEYFKIADMIGKAVRSKRGNYMIFFPSYQMMDAVYDIYQEKIGFDGDICFQKQNARMDESERETFLNAFHDEKQITVGFCIMGGIFSEGIDLIGERLIGAIVVGTGIPGIGSEREILMRYYDKHDGKGFDYAYRYPGMNKVLQAAGRVIRTDKDRGIILLLDDRFLTYEYQQLFPREWSDYTLCTRDNLNTQLELFWEDNS